VNPVLEELPFLSATADLTEMRKAIRPLARKLAVRVAMKRRRSTRGTLDIRRTIRHAMSTGGVPFVTEFRHRPPHRPELVLLCDVSSSVARFARFSLMLTHSLSAQFSRVRSFAFVDAIDEVTHLFEHEDFVAAVDRMNREALVVRSDGHSDYGSILESFLDHHGDVVTARTTLLILGDARNNYRARRTHALRELAHRARHTYWLNPEPIHDWDTGDSAATEYAAHVHRMVEVRNLRQLEAFIAKEL
ncbi:MAG TPA: VWA domain-containing protein, partial [Actinomycetota bacterium]|nr:VWA domain-containing protein [Actinomycetota bacterium]